MDNEIAALCVSDQAKAHAAEGHAGAAMAACNTITATTWRDECHFLVAEGLISRRVQDAVAACQEAGQFLGQCTSHIVWFRRPWPVQARPDDSTAQNAVDRFVGSFPPKVNRKPPSVWVDPARHVRARAWFEIYFGSGSAHPAAARGASRGDMPMAHSAFAWEAVRLLGPEREVATLVDEVSQVWDGRLAPPTGEKASPGCWKGWFPPGWRGSLVGAADIVEVIDGSLRLVGGTDEADLLIATLEAIYALNQGGSPDDLAPWLDDERAAVRLTAVRLAATTWPEGSAPLRRVDKRDREVVLAVGTDLRNGWRLQPPPRPATVECTE